jgi:predicted dehydrogenase
VRIGMIGAGGIARTHAGHLRELEGVRVAAVMDPVLERAEALAAECEARAHADLEPLLDEVDVVYVCSPPMFHRAQVEAAAAAGRHVYLEKPIATTLEDGRAIAAALTSSPVRSIVGFNNRFRPAFRRWRELALELGPSRSAWVLRMAPSTPLPNANWRTTPGLLCGITVESASHDIDLVRWALGEVGSVSGSTTSSLPELEGFDDTLSAVLRVEDGPVVALSVSWASAVSTSSRGFVGTGGSAMLVGPDMWTVTELRWARSDGPEAIETIEPAEGSALGYRAASEHFVACVREGRDPEVGVRDGLVALGVSLALKRSADSGLTIACDPAIG